MSHNGRQYEMCRNLNTNLSRSKKINMKHISKLLRLTKAYFILLVSGWHTLDLTPPNKRVQVKDMNGNIAMADPTYYPFEVKKLDGDERKQWGWRGTPVFYGNRIEKWDGGWMILCEGLSSKIDSDIVWWRVCR